ncbi:hypothetical protein CPB83DRAFT_908886 [Crepidotus variabilis]|uniref:(4-O-methyl)-D-glucuronate--lignin esterase n=1 Tax=Crepidotus variabilis TaxID=179855 RepID=A0A9P6JMK7_9AGAR|nr:hypothetical protein CPB83DRAFT_908886 [Crepidotus variabilis]
MFLITLSVIFLAAQRVYSQCTPLPTPLPRFGSLTATNVLPNPFVFYNGTAVASPADWNCRRQEIKTILQEYLFGYYPDHSKETVTATRSGNTISITVTAGGKSGKFSATLALPSGATKDKPAPVMIVLGFGDSTFVSNGIATATFDAGSVAADSNSKTGAFWSIYNGQDVGVLLAWGWGFHRVLDALIQVAPEVDPKRVGVNGCSRYGKAALAGGIFDDRITVTNPQSSGVFGVSPFRFRYESGGWNERLESNVNGAGWWTKSNLKEFIPDEKRLPLDSNFLASAVAPRAAVWDNGQGDAQMNPEGVAGVTFPSTQAVYKWLGATDNVGLALRSGGHCDPSGTSNDIDFIKSILLGTTRTKNYANTSPYKAHPETYPWLTT